MENIEKDIAKVNTDIAEVTKEIKTVVNQIDAFEYLFDKEYEEWTQKEKNKYGNHTMLREEENKLREEKNKLVDILLEKIEEINKIMVISEPALGRGFKNTFRLSFIKALYNEMKGIVVSRQYFEPKIASRRYSNKSDPELMDQCRATLKSLNWEEKLLKFEDIEIDCVLRCYSKRECSVEFAEPAKLLLPKILNQVGVITRKISENSIDEESDSPNGYIVAEITSKSDKLEEKMMQLEKHLLFLLVRHQKGQNLQTAPIESIISYVFLIIPYSPLKKPEMDSRIQNWIEEKKGLCPLVFTLYTFGCFGRFYTQPGGTAVFTEMTRHVSDNASSAHDSSLGYNSEKMKKEKVVRLKEELLAARLIDSVSDRANITSLLEKELIRTIKENNQLN